MRSIVIAGLTAALTVAAAQARAGTSIDIRPGQTATGYGQDMKACAEAAAAWPADDESGLPPPVGGADPIDMRYRLVAHSGLLGAWAASDVDKHSRDSLRRACLWRRGYSPVALTEAEAREFAALPPDGRAAWLEHFSIGIAQRVQEGRTGMPTPLPEATNDAYAIGAVRLQPDSLTAARTAVAAKGVLVTGQAAHRRTGRVVAAFDIFSAPVEAGAELMQFGSPVPWNADVSPTLTWWCLKLKGSPRPGLVPLGGNAVWCVRAGAAGYDVVTGSLTSNWLPTAVPDTTYFRPIHGPVRIEPDDHDALGPMDFALVVEKVTPDKVTLAAHITDASGKPALIWRGAKLFDASGQATLPFWGRRLVIVRDGNGVKGRFEDGDGRGWMVE